MNKRHCLFGLAACVLAWACFESSCRAGNEPTAPATPKTASAKAPGQKANSASKPGSQPAPASQGNSAQVSYSGTPVLDPANYYGTAAVGYAAAKAAPDVMSKLFCYCGCDITDKHKQLVDCFTSMHGVDCHICQEEAVMGLKLHRAGTPLAAIQKQIDEEFAKNYPFQEESASLKQYKTSRLWKGEPMGTAGLQSDEGPIESGSKAGTAPKFKPGFQAGPCCNEKAAK